MMQKILAAALVASLAFGTAGCKSLDAYTGEEKTSSTAKGSAIGAAIGAVIGYASAKDKDRRDKRKAILAGAAVGGLGGAAVGAYMDRQEEELREKLEGTGVSVTRSDDDLILNMPGNVTFDTDSSQLKSSFSAVLDSVALVLKEYDQTLVEAAGHTDSTGSNSYNQNLSQQRAYSVGNYLIDQGINSDRVLTIGHGESRPIADNKTPAGREQNRRVELTLVPITES